MHVPSLPTDSLYKFTALAGLVLCLFAIYYPPRALMDLLKSYTQSVVDMKAIATDLQSVKTKEGWTQNQIEQELMKSASVNNELGGILTKIKAKTASVEDFERFNQLKTESSEIFSRLNELMGSFESGLETLAELKKRFDRQEVEAPSRDAEKRWVDTIVAIGNPIFWLGMLLEGIRLTNPIWLAWSDFAQVGG